MSGAPPVHVLPFAFSLSLSFPLYSRFFLPFSHANVCTNEIARPSPPSPPLLPAAPRRVRRPCEIKEDASGQFWFKWKLQVICLSSIHLGAWNCCGKITSLCESLFLDSFILSRLSRHKAIQQIDNFVKVDWFYDLTQPRKPILLVDVTFFFFLSCFFFFLHDCTQWSREYNSDSEVAPYLLQQFSTNYLGLLECT